MPPPLHSIPPQFPFAGRNPKTTTMAVLSLVFGILGWCGGIGGILAVIFGHLGKAAIRRSMGSLGGAGLCTAGLVLGYLSLAAWVGLALLIWAGNKFAAPVFDKMAQNMAAAQSAPFDISNIPVPAFPELPASVPIADGRVRVMQVKLNGGRGPGQRMSFRVYLPRGNYPPHSLPCVLVAPAGTTLLTGVDLDPLDSDSYHAECLPYAEAGMVVVLYSLDGPPLTRATDSFEAMKVPFMQFSSAAAGVVNGRNALEFALSRIPVVDPGRISAAGHSSAGTLALLLAAHEPRLFACVAYAPESDVEGYIGTFLSDLPEHEDDIIKSKDVTPSLMNLALPGFSTFIKRSSPLAHVDRISLPVLLFHSEDDETVPIAHTKAFVGKLSAHSTLVKLVTVPEGGHYLPMIEEGIPKGIEWLRERGKTPAGQR